LARYRMQFDFTRDKMTWTRLQFDPGLPKKFGKKGSGADSLDTMASLTDMVSRMVRPAPVPKVVPRGFLGIEFAEPRGKDQGVRIKAVLAKSPAALAGVKPGDEITHIQGDEVSLLLEVRLVAATLQAGQKVRLTVLRKGESRQIEFKAGEGL
jgi:serine protease Do